MFYVYGVSMTLARKVAKKKCSTHDGVHPNRRLLTPEEYQAKLVEMTAERYKKMKPQRLSHSLSTPSLCSQYIALANTQEAHRDLHVRYRKSTGKTNPKTRKEIFSWVVYTGGLAA
jgi:hypothetical protein